MSTYYVPRMVPDNGGTCNKRLKILSQTRQQHSEKGQKMQLFSTASYRF